MRTTFGVTCKLGLKLCYSFKLKQRLLKLHLGSYHHVPNAPKFAKKMVCQPGSALHQTPEWIKGEKRARRERKGRRGVEGT